MIMNGAYFNGLDQTKNGNGYGLQTALKNIPGSVTTDYMLCSLNVTNTSADINYGWNLPCVLASGGKVTEWTRTHLCQVVSTGFKQGKLQRVWLTIGGATNGDATTTFTNIQKILTSGDSKLIASLLANFGAIVQALIGVTGFNNVGFDMDYEENVDDIASVVANVTIALWNAVLKQFQYSCPITFCPYQDVYQSAWIGALQKVYAGCGIQPVVGYNLQTYQGGGGNDPGDWANNIAKAKNTGVSDAKAFVWPILSCISQDAPWYKPGAVAGQLKSWDSTGFHSKGASLWASLGLSPQSPNSLTDYGKAIAQGIE